MKRQKKQNRYVFGDRQPSTEANVESMTHILGQIRFSKTISRSQHCYLVSSLLANNSEVQPYRSLINRILEATQSGTLQLTD